MSAVELFPEGTTARRAPAAPYEWPLTPGATSTMRADLGWDLAELGPAAATAKDLLRVMAAAYLADRTTSRPPQTLHREAHLFVHVEQPDAWTETALDTTVDLLHWLTGDTWSLEVLSAQPATDSTRPAAQTEPVDAVSLLSGGLDSMCGALLRLHMPETTLFLGHLDTSNAVRRAQGAVKTGLQARRADLRYQRFALRPIAPLRESTPRTRSLLFMAMAIATAAGCGAGRILVPENGFTSINPPLEPARGGPLTTRSTHPWTFHALRGLLDKLGLRDLAVSNPHGHLTKGELVADALQPRSEADRTLAAATLSCAMPNAGRPKGGNANLNCGLCIACLVRRGAFLAARRRDDTVYLIDTLTGDAKAGFVHSRRHDISAWTYATQAGFDEYRVLASGLWPPGTDFDAVLDLCQRGLKELRRVRLT